MKRTYSTDEAARAVGVGRVTLQRWIAAGKVSVPKLTRVGGVRVRLWTERDVARLEKQLGKLYHPEKVRSGKKRGKSKKRRP